MGEPWGVAPVGKVTNKLEPTSSFAFHLTLGGFERTDIQACLISACGVWFFVGAGVKLNIQLSTAKHALPYVNTASKTGGGGGWRTVLYHHLT